MPSSGVTREVLYAADVIIILGLDRLTRPDNALNDLLARRALPRRKLRGRLIFHRAELDAVLANGSRTGRRGRPKGSKSKPSGADAA